MAVNQDFKKSTVSTTNHTQNYDLPLWAGEDTTSWLTQMNDAMNKIDDGMVDAKSKALEVVGIAADAKKLADETKAESAASAKIVAGYNDRLTAVEDKSKEHTTDITNLNVRSDQFDVELHSVQEVQKKTTADLATLAAKVDSNKTDVDAKITANTSAIAQTDANVATISGKVTALETEVGEVSSATQSNTNAITAINGSIESIKSKDSAQDKQIVAINTEVNSLDARVSTLEEGGGSSASYQYILNAIELASISKNNYTIVNSEAIIGDSNVLIRINFKTAKSISAGGAPMYIDDSCQFITKLKEKFGNNLWLYGMNGNVRYGSGADGRYIPGVELTRTGDTTPGSTASTTINIVTSQTMASATSCELIVCAIPFKKE